MLSGDNLQTSLYFGVNSFASKRVKYMFNQEKTFEKLISVILKQLLISKIKEIFFNYSCKETILKKIIEFILVESSLKMILYITDMIYSLQLFHLA